MAVYRKFLVAAAAALGVAASVLADGELSAVDACAILSAAIGALLVYATPNAASVTTMQAGATTAEGDR